MLTNCTALGLTPTTQRFCGPEYGECVRVSYAAIFDLDPRDVPRFDPASLHPGENQRSREKNWLAMLGLKLVEVPPVPLSALPPDLLGASVPRGYHLVTGLSPRGPFGHRCVGRGGQVCWDPHPSRAGLVSTWSLGFVLPMVSR